MITTDDYAARGWIVSDLNEGFKPDPDVIRDMSDHRESPGRSSVGTQNMLYAMILSFKPKIVLEVGSHIGSASVWIGAALKENGFGKAYCLEPQQHYFDLHTTNTRLCGVDQQVDTLQIYSTDDLLKHLVGEPVDMVFLDANHSYSSAYTDLQVVDSLLSDRGIILLDDSGLGHSADIDGEQKGGVRQALIDFGAEHPDYSISFFDHPFWLNPCGLALAVRHKGADLRTSHQRIEQGIG